MNWIDVVRLGSFAGVLLVLALAELRWPRRAHEHGRHPRWPSNVGLVVLDTTLVRVIAPLGVVGVALWAEQAEVGLLHRVSVPAWMALPATVALLDLTVYLQHVVLHRVPWLWRLHRVHHADVDVDVTTGLRFHPAEMVLSLAMKSAVVAAVGGGPAAVLTFEILLNVSSMFTHANVDLPARIDRLVRRVVVTPDMHRVHHSVRSDECNTNFGFMLPWWDQLCGTYREQPARGHQAMTLGVETFRNPADQRLDRLLAQPWTQDASVTQVAAASRHEVPPGQTAR